MEEQNPYEVMGLEATATDKEIKERWRQLANIFHPDRNNGSYASEKKFKEIKAAYEMILRGDAVIEEEEDLDGDDRRRALHEIVIFYSKLVNDCVEHGSPYPKNVLKVIREACDDILEKNERNVGDAYSKKEEAKKLYHRVISKKIGKNIFDSVVSDFIDAIDKEIVGIKENSRIMRAVIKVVDDFTMAEEEDFDPENFLESERKRISHKIYQSIFGSGS